MFKCLFKKHMFNTKSPVVTNELLNRGLIRFDLHWRKIVSVASCGVSPEAEGQLRALKLQKGVSNKGKK